MSFLLLLVAGECDATGFEEQDAGSRKLPEPLRKIKAMLLTLLDTLEVRSPHRVPGCWLMVNELMVSESSQGSCVA